MGRLGSVGALVVLMAAGPACAQLQLPGGAPAGALPPPTATVPMTGEMPKPKPKVETGAPVRTGSEESIAGRPLYLNGFQGLMQVERVAAPPRPPVGKGRAAPPPSERLLRIVKLTLPGDKVSQPGQSCKVEAVASEPLEVKSTGRPDGSWRYDAPIEGCAFSFDVLDGAVLVPRLAQACTFAATDCTVDPSGLWGPTPAVLGGERAKEIERSRFGSESALRANFRALMAKADRTQAKTIAREQAAFSSEREEICRSYAREEQHGFCAARITEARAASLALRAGGAAALDRPKPKPRPKPVMPLPPPDPPPIQ